MQAFLAAALAIAAPAASGVAGAPRIEALASPVTVRLRGLSAATDAIAWASGREGTVVHTTDGGRTWRVSRVPGAEALDFRDVQAFGANEAIVMGAGPGDASRVYRTTDGGATWNLVLRNTDATGFFDCMDFDGDEGRLLGDPVGGRFQLYASHDRGATWAAVAGPVAADGEAAFAASGTCVKRLDGATVVATGGSKARVHFLPDRFQRKADWHALAVDGIAPAASSGLFSIVARQGDLLAVGGDYKAEALAAPAFGVVAWPDAVRTHAGNARGAPVLRRDGNTEVLERLDWPRRWEGVRFERFVAFTGSPSGYRSGVACGAAAGGTCVATGPSGTDVLPAGSDLVAGSDGVRVADVASRWTRLSDAGYDSVATAGRVFWFSGDGGRLGRLELPPSD